MRPRRPDLGRRIPAVLRLRPDPAAACPPLRAATGARATAGDAESGTLDLLLAHPVTRTRVNLQRFGALTAGACGIAAAVRIAMLAIRESADLTSVSPAEFLAQCLNLALLAVATGAFAVGIGAATGSGPGLRRYRRHRHPDLRRAHLRGPALRRLGRLFLTTTSAANRSSTASSGSTRAFSPQRPRR
ncbi:ABC transporter permease subunit [Streptomyces sp. NPDC005507]|uniref:ABC transporter permease subunit n=1 Tax=unclassified Streptomyces TaxID=2593676 RepID=UPI0033B762F7